VRVWGLIFAIILSFSIVYNIDIVNNERNDIIDYDIAFSDFRISKLTEKTLEFDAKSKKGLLGKNTNYILEDVSFIKKKDNDFESIMAGKMIVKNDGFLFSGEVKYSFRDLEIMAYEIKYFNDKLIGKNFILRSENMDVLGSSIEYDFVSEVIKSSLVNIFIKDK